MAQEDYMPRADEDKAALFTHFAATIPLFYTPLGLSAADPDLNNQAADALAFRYLLNQQQILLAAGQQASTAKARLRDGDPTDPNSPVTLAFPAAPATSPAPVPPGVVRRFRNLVRRIKAGAGYTPAIGESLKIVGDEASAELKTTESPEISLRLNGGQVEVVWKKGSYDSVEIHVDRGDAAGFTLLAIDTRPNYIDTQDLPTTAARWRYKAIYRKDDARTGQWCAVQEIVVGA